VKYASGEDQVRCRSRFSVLACLDGADLSKACFVLLVEKELMDSILAGVA